jgi:hypothetical protein
MCVSRFKLPRLFAFVKKCVRALSFSIVEYAFVLMVLLVILS